MNTSAALASATPAPAPAPVTAKVTVAPKTIKRAVAPAAAPTVEPTVTKPVKVAKPGKTPTLRRGVKKAEVVTLVEKFKFPTEPFTLKQIVYAFGVDHWYIVAYVKAHAKIVGDAPKTPGVRGKAAKLYQIDAAAQR
jgi:hypothetical protein